MVNRLGCVKHGRGQEGTPFLALQDGICWRNGNQQWLHHPSFVCTVNLLKTHTERGCTFTVTVGAKRFRFTEELLRPDSLVRALSLRCAATVQRAFRMFLHFFLAKMFCDK